MHTHRYNNIHATWALGQLAATSKTAATHILELAGSGSPEVKAQAGKLIGDHQLHGGYQHLINALDDSSDRVKYFAALSLGKLGNPEAADALSGLLLINNDRDVYLRHAAIMGLVGTADKQALAKASKSPYRSVRLGALLVYRRLENPAVAQFLTDSDVTLVQEAARAIIGANISHTFPALAALSTQVKSLDTMLGLRVLNAHFREGTPANAQALAAFAANTNASAELRAEAIHHLSTWANPPARDRIIGLFRPLPSRNGKIAEKALAEVFDRLLDAPELVQSKAIETATEMQLTSLTKDLFAKFQNESTPSSVRITILNTLLKMNDSRLERAATIANESNDTALRLATLPVLAKLSPASSAPLLKQLAETGSAREQRAAFKALGTMSHPIAISALVDSLQRLKSGKIPNSAQLELLEAAESVNHPQINLALEARNKTISESGDPLAPFQYTLAGGSHENGRRVFEGNQVMPCLRCHVTDGLYSGEPGPSLMGIASKHDASYMLESIIKPSKQMAAGFEMAIVTTKGREILVGMVAEETDAELKLKLADGNNISIAKPDIATRQTAPSTMPEIFGNTLSRSDLRDLVAYLSSLSETFEESSHALEGF